LQATAIAPRIGNSASSQTARWIQRDYASTKKEPNTYEFAANDSQNKFDRLGLDTTFLPGTPHVSNDRHNNYLIFQISCPKGWRVRNVKAVYNDSNMYAEMYDYYTPVVQTTESTYENIIGDAIDHTFGGLQDPGTPNCLGNPVEAHAFMRTRLVAPGWQFELWRAYYGTPDPNTMISIYQENTSIFWVCDSCCGRGLSK